MRQIFHFLNHISCRRRASNRIRTLRSKRLALFFSLDHDSMVPESNGHTCQDPELLGRHMLPFRLSLAGL
ncbi:hypothetical protein EYC80_009017 [Monilinia laxa]|uniref:Uncharacterized protein n=1 Tax=Monilinia laxa TaxID=61186 RepID=A0A5N6K266_MONLA|nr:hypothetical protein EYC80_009017 [Monilinia laxa]